MGRETKTAALLYIFSVPSSSPAGGKKKQGKKVMPCQVTDKSPSTEDGFLAAEFPRILGRVQVIFCMSMREVLKIQYY